jgi:4-amino-4-deoxy-L-arabinose transferase-like glycosyltransferase
MHELVSQKSVTSYSRWRASWQTLFFFLLLSRSLMLTNKVPSPILTLSVYLCSPWAEEHQNIHYMNLHDFLQNYMHGTKRHQALQKLRSNAQNDKPRAYALLFTRLIVIFTHYIMSYFPAFLVCLSLSLLQLLPSRSHPSKQETTTTLVKQAC